MNLVEKLLLADKGKIEEIEKKEMKSRRLSIILGEETKIKIQALDSEEFIALTGSAADSNGNYDYSKGYDVNAKLVAAGMIEPNLKNEELLKHLGAVTPAEAAKKLFKGEINKISLEIAKLSGFSDEEETDNEIKN